jgi:uncharacterized membrane protein YeaQ/YmgE (transglycosylase-associated protein family)
MRPMRPLLVTGCMLGHHTGTYKSTGVGADPAVVEEAPDGDRGKTCCFAGSSPAVACQRHTGSFPYARSPSPRCVYERREVVAIERTFGCDACGLEEERGGRCSPATWRHKEHMVTVTGIISAIIVGLIIGALGRLVLPGRQAIPIWLTILIGIVAALIGTFIANALDVGDTAGFDWIELIIQIALAAVGVALIAGRYAPGRRRY